MKFLFYILSVILLITGCDNKSTEPDSITLNYSDYIFIDTYHQIWVTHPDDYPPGEMVLERELSYGEPFNDVNNNGVYEKDIDVFIISDDENNQDLDRNGQYTPPGFESWSPGMQFDDIDGDGVCDIADYISTTYSTNKPFCDYNQNGVHDTGPELGNMYFILVCNSFVDNNNIIRYEMVEYSDIFYFVSNADLRYTLPGGNYYGTPLSFSRDANELIIDGERFTVSIPFAKNYFENSNDVPLTIAGDDDVLEQDYLFTRRAYFNQTLNINDTTYTDLLLVQFDDPKYAISGKPANGNIHLKFYFYPYMGLLAIENTLDGENGSEEYYLNVRIKGIPIPMVQ